MLAHEVGHYKKKHILQGIIGNVLEIGVMLYLLSLLIYSPDLYQAFYMEQGSIYAGLLFFALLYTPVDLVLSIIRKILSRKNEYEADRFAAETIDEPEDLVAALKKLALQKTCRISHHTLSTFF